MPRSIAGCEHAKSSARRSSGIGVALEAAASISSARSFRWSAASTRVRRRREASIALRRATVNSHASGLAGTPLSGQSTSAEAKASESASSAPATSRVRDARKATSFP
jgi:hypothetical protein